MIKGGMKMKEKNHLTLVISNKRNSRKGFCTFTILEQPKGKCSGCFHINACLIEVIRTEAEIPVLPNAKYPQFLKRIEGLINKANMIWEERKGGLSVQ
jgi:hypothetical protein